MKRQKYSILICFASVLTGLPLAQGETLTLAQYREQVKAKHSGYQSAATMSSAAAEKAVESQLVLQPSLFSQAQQSIDQKENPNPSLQGDKLSLQGLTVGLNQPTRFGLQAKVSYQLNASQVTGANPQLVPNKKYIDGHTVVEISQPLWRNAYGGETSSRQLWTEQLSSAQAAGEKFKQQGILMEAELTYWRLVAAKATLAIQRQARDRTQKWREWASRRTSLQLGDRADLLAAEAALRSRDFEIESGLAEVRAASYAFNTLRGEEQEEVREEVSPLNPELVASLEPPKPAAVRLDVNAAELSYQAAQLNEKLNTEKYKPQLEAFASLTFNGRDESLGKAFGESLGPKHPSTLLGLRFQTLLGGDILERQKSAVHQETEAQRLGLERKRFEVAREWHDLQRRYDEAKVRMRLSADMEQAQLYKLDYEKERLRIGRTTTFQVLLYENDYFSAQLQRLRAAAELAKIVSQMRLFAAND